MWEREKGKKRREDNDDDRERERKTVEEEDLEAEYSVVVVVVVVGGETDEATETRTTGADPLDGEPLNERSCPTLLVPVQSITSW